MSNVTTALEWSPLWAAMKANKTQWITTTESMYFEMLECLPPVAMRSNAFLVGEPDHHNAEGKPVYACFKKSGGSFAAKYATIEDFYSVAA